ncbi:tubulin-specific chaperone D-like isoform X2 [Bolinopsis microptera]|uniref:tubulin-specific chaperone D-like isoform X2 n=1 Tax=Bolinopsis microptera TaxID=2820187 RepID=UPI0030792BAB
MPSADTQSATVSWVDPQDTKDIDQYIANLWDVKEFDIYTERDVQKITEIINFYQEQPHVLDPHLQEWIDKLLVVGLSDKVSQMAINLAFKYLYLLTKVRGQKYIVRLLPHEVADIETVLSLLESEKSDIWHAKYVLFLWLSILVLIPFDLKRLDGEREEGWSIRRMLKIATDRIEGADKSSEAAALVVAKLVTRPDLHTQHLKPTIIQLITDCKAAENDAVFGSKTKLGTLTALCRIYKLGRRDYILPHSQYVLQQLESLSLGLNQNTLLRKFETKLAQRIGISFLAPRVAKWRYTRGTRLLADSLGKGSDEKEKEKEKEKVEDVKDPENEDEDEEGYEIPDEIEEVLEVLFRGLRDPETIVRWSAAKGVGRITARLPRSLATDIVNQLLDCFSPLETASSWHGGCLALAELGRHGFLLPDHLPEVVPILVKALQYDEKRGNLIIGANVRDAACYLCWSFARTYEPAQIAPFVHTIASSLILATLFDRHCGCRRAASAAFQENVGRQGSFPHGIDLVTTCDYYAVALQSNTYQKLSVKVASFEPYSKPVIDHLAEVKVRHWCPTIRKDASVALGLLCSILPDYIYSNVLPLLLESLETGDFNCRHGALHAIGDICVGLKNRDHISVDLVDKINNTLTVLDTRGSFRGSGGDEMRGAVCYFIEKISNAGVALTGKTIKAWQEFLDVCIVNPEQFVGVQAMSVESLRGFSYQYYTEFNPEVWSGIVEHYTSHIRHEFTATRVGSALALSVLPGCVLNQDTMVLLNFLPPCTKVQSKSETSLAECRVSAVKAITNVQLVCQCNSETRGRIYAVLLECLEDYSTDSRGDIGSYVREAAMSCLMKCNQFILSKGHPTINLTFTRDLKLELVRGFLQQSVEKIDRTRQVAMEALHHLVHSELELTEHDSLRAAVPLLPTLSSSVILPKTEKEKEAVAMHEGEVFLQNVEYNNPNVLFPRSMALLTSPNYIISFLRGLVVSIGGLTESLVKASSSAFVDYLTEHEEDLQSVCDGLIKVLVSDYKNDRVVVPLFKTVELMLTNVILDDEMGNGFVAKFVHQIKLELKGCGSVGKLLATLSPLANCLQFTDNSCVLSQIMLLLCHRYPRVRKGMADAFYTALVTFDDVISNTEEISQILEETVWEDPNDIDELRAKRNKICDLVGVSQPKLLKSSKAKPKASTVEQFDSYSDLVGRAGY